MLLGLSLAGSQPLPCCAFHRSAAGRGRWVQSSGKSGLVPCDVGVFDGRSGRPGFGRWDGVGGAPDREVAEQLFVDVRRQHPLPRHPIGRTCPLGLVRDLMLEALDPAGQAVEVGARARFLS